MKKNLVKRLQNAVKLRSVNSLGNIYPDEISEWLGTSNYECHELIKELHDQRVITFKYRVKCDCGEVCTIYERKLLRDHTVNCEICGKEFSVDDIDKNANILYEIDKEELLGLNDESVDIKILPDIERKVVPMVKIQEKREMEIFMGSSSEAVNFMEEIAVKLEELDAQPLLWNETGKGIFIPGASTIDALIAITKRVKAAIFIFNADDKIWNIKSSLEKSDAVRDNVLFEYGLFMGALGKEKVCFVCKDQPQVASDLKGITYIDGNESLTKIKLKLRDWINAIQN